MNADFFKAALDELEQAVAKLARQNPAGYRAHPKMRLLRQFTKPLLESWLGASQRDCWRDQAAADQRLRTSARNCSRFDRIARRVLAGTSVSS